MKIKGPILLHFHFTSLSLHFTSLTTSWVGGRQRGANDGGHGGMAPGSHRLPPLLVFSKISKHCRFLLKKSTQPFKKLKFCMKIGKPCYLCYDKQNRLVTRGWRLVTIFFFFLSFSLSFFSFSSFSFYLFYLFYLFFSLLCLLSLLSFLSLFPVYEIFEIVYIYMSI